MAPVTLNSAGSHQSHIQILVEQAHDKEVVRELFSLILETLQGEPGESLNTL